METRLSSKGQVVLPGLLRRRLGLRPGDPLDANIAGDSIVLTPRRKAGLKPAIVRDAVTGFPVLTAGRAAPPLTDEQVRAILTDFP